MPDFIYRPPSSPLDLLLVDDDILVANKPAGLLSVPGRLAEHKDSLMLRLEVEYGEVHCVHRLDMDTSGIMLVARNKAALSNLSRQFQQRTVEKIYHAIILGKLKNIDGEISAPLITDWPNRPKQKICYESGKPSTTRYRQIANHEAFSLVELYPITGRSHQLRVHLMSTGNPILGCRFYANDSALRAAPRLMLHASVLEFSHPTTEQKTSIHCENQFELLFPWLKQWQSFENQLHL